MVSAKTLMSAEKGYVPMAGAGTRLDHLIANVQLDFIFQVMEDSVLITTSVNKQECVPMVSALIWTDPSNVVAMKVI